MAKRKPYQLWVENKRWYEPDEIFRLEGELDGESLQLVRTWLDAGIETAWCLVVVECQIFFALPPPIGDVVCVWKTHDVIGGMSYASEVELWEAVEEYKMTENTTWEAIESVLKTIASGTVPLQSNCELAPREIPDLAKALAKWLEKNPKWAVKVDEWYLKNP